MGYTITPDCQKRDVDECVFSNGLCHPNAACENLDGTLEKGTHNCHCAAGMVGDGVTSCDVYIYTTIFKVAIDGTLPTAVNVQNVITTFFGWGVLPTQVNPNSVNVTLYPYSPPHSRRLLSDGEGGVEYDTDIIHPILTPNTPTPANETETPFSVPSSTPADETETETATTTTFTSTEEEGKNRDRFDSNRLPVAERRLLSTATGTLFKFNITTSTQAQMELITSLIDLTKLLNGYVLVENPYSQILTIDSTFGAVNTFLAGFVVDSVVFSNEKERWLVNARYQNDLPNTITGLYLSKPGPAPYSETARNSFYVSQHPCMRSMSVCCLLEFRDQYVIGQLGDNITQTLGTCDEITRNKHTLGMFDPREDEVFVDNVFSNFPDSSVHRSTPQNIQLVIAETDLMNSFTMRENITNTNPAGQGYKLSFFVGMAYYTLLPANAISTIASQTQINIQVTNSLTFSFASEQDYRCAPHLSVSIP